MPVTPFSRSLIFVFCLCYFLHTSFPPSLVIRTNITCLKETPHHASLHHWPVGLFTRSFASRSQPWPIGLLCSSWSLNSCPYQTSHRCPCAPHVRSSRPHYCSRQGFSPCTFRHGWFQLGSVHGGRHRPPFSVHIDPGKSRQKCLLDSKAEFQVPSER